MFRNRQSSQKPSDELYKNFKANFPQLTQHPDPASTTITSSALPLPASSSLADALTDPSGPRPVEHHFPQDVKDADSTPRGCSGPWHFGSSGLTPNMMDPNSQNFTMFTDNMPGYYTPGGNSNNLYQTQAGDLHTPTYGGAVGLGTPLSMPTSESAVPAGQHATQYQPYPPANVPPSPSMHQPPFQNVNPYHMHHQQQQQSPYHQQQFGHHYDVMDGHVEHPSEHDIPIDMRLHSQQPPTQHRHSTFSNDVLLHAQHVRSSMQHMPPHPNGESFRYHVTLNAPTAMIKHADEIPVTYLNKGQVYTLNVVDTHNHQAAGPLRFRTFVRVSFEDEQQRAKPSACWQLWKEGRGTNEAHQRGGRLQAVEYVESAALGGTDDPSKPRIELESASFDGFCVTWSPPAGAVECPISVRFNFLSTDFSHSKGVKGIPVRLCAKTELLPAAQHYGPSATQDVSSEVCYCKVKLFRDHGAERKLSNDVAHVKKTIDKLNQQIAQIESGMRDLGKRKRGPAKSLEGERPGKIPKHRRTWSLSSVTSTGGRGSAEEDLHIKLMTLQDMFTSTRPASVLYLRGADEDDADLHPVKLSNDSSAPPLVKGESTETSNWDRNSNSSAVSPTPSNNSLAGSRRDSTLQQPTPFDTRLPSNDWQPKPQTAITDLQTSHLASPPDNQPMKVPTLSSSNGNVSGWIEAVGIDPAYEPPRDRPVKATACFYARFLIHRKATNDKYYRAVYLNKRTLKDFVNAVAGKVDIEPTRVMQTVRVNELGLEILVDDECIEELAEGQDMVIEVGEATSETPMKTSREWDAGPTDVQCDGDLPTMENLNTSGFELKLRF